MTILGSKGLRDGEIIIFHDPTTDMALTNEKRYVKFVFETWISFIPTLEDIEELLAEMCYQDWRNRD